MSLAAMLLLSCGAQKLVALDGNTAKVVPANEKIEPKIVKEPKTEERFSTQFSLEIYTPDGLPHTIAPVPYQDIVLSETFRCMTTIVIDPDAVSQGFLCKLDDTEFVVVTACYTKKLDASMAMMRVKNGDDQWTFMVVCETTKEIVEHKEKPEIHVQM